MNQITSVKADPDATRPVYTGMAWRSQAAGGRPREAWLARSETTPICYVVEAIEEGRWVSRQGFQDQAGRPNTEIGVFPDRAIAMTACERHDFGFWSSCSQRVGLKSVFMGSPDHVGDFVSALPDHERDDLLDMLSGGYQLPDGRNFSQAASHFPATKSGLKQEKSGAYTATFSIEAVDVPLWLMHAPPGAQLAIGAVHVTTEDQTAWSERSAHALRRSFALVLDNNFHAWLASHYDNWGLIKTAMTKTSEEVERAVEETLRRLIGCPSRRDLGTNRDAVVRLEKIDREFYLDLSRGFSAP